MPPITPTADQFPQTIYGIHDVAGSDFLKQNNTSGWLVQAVNVNADPPVDYRTQVSQGMRVIVRLNNGYSPNGTIPVPSQYAAFAQHCADYVNASHGVAIWIIGNEMNASFERPNGQPILPTQYASCFTQVRDAIHAKPGHANDQVIVGATAPYNIETTYPANPTGDWVKYFADVLAVIGDRCDGISVHCYSRGQAASAITDPAKYPAPYQNNYQGFLAYQNFMNAVPTALRKLPAYITETQPIIGSNPNWLNENTGWVRAAFSEINRWNSIKTNQPIQALTIFRWLNTDPNWCFSTRPNVLDDYRAALTFKYHIVLPTILPPTQTLEQAVMAAAHSVPWMPVNNQAALWKYAKSHGLQDQQTAELPMVYDGEKYLVQVFNLGIPYVKVGDWANINVVPK